MFDHYNDRHTLCIPLIKVIGSKDGEKRYTLPMLKKATINKTLESRNPPHENKKPNKISHIN